ncbi:MAG: hypothetical protein WBQ44_14820 [Rhodococcus sp. (in: high G+C Gram-positive bacteria)]
MSEQPARATSVTAVLAAVLVAAAGGAAFVYGGADDSPGLQLIGVILVVGANAVPASWRC